MINDYKKLPIGKWLEIRDVQRDEAIEDKYTKTVAMLSILSDIPEEELYDLKLEDFSKMTGEMAFLMKEVPQVPVCDRYKLGEYNLVLVRDLKELTASQFIDYQTFIILTNTSLNCCPYSLFQRERNTARIMTLLMYRKRLERT